MRTGVNTNVLCCKRKKKRSVNDSGDEQTVAEQCCPDYDDDSVVSFVDTWLLTDYAIPVPLLLLLLYYSSVHDADTFCSLSIVNMKACYTCI